MKYLLVEVIERNINTPGLFETYEEAYDTMCECVANARHITVDDLKANLDEDGIFDEDTGVTENEAWTEKYGQNFDWKIFSIGSEVKLWFI